MFFCYLFQFIEYMIKVTKVIGGCVSSQRLEIVIPSPPAKKGNKQLLVLIETKIKLSKLKYSMTRGFVF